MKPTALFFSLFFLLASTALSQTNVRAWYADGQVWVVWEASLPLPETYAVYAKPTPFTNTANATLAGRLFQIEYGAGALKEQVDPAATFRIPDGMGGLYQLALNEGLFVATPHQAGALYFAVVAWGETTVTAGVNITDAAVPFQYNPQTDPVECHLQAVFPSPFAAGFTCLAYYSWADGRQNQWENRPDFPVMANQAKNGMPSLFFISIPNGLDTTQAFPLTVWLHGGGGTAKQSLAGSRSIVNLKPEQGILLAHNDDVAGYRGMIEPPGLENPDWHFGWRKNWDPFTPNNQPTTLDTIVNYTQRRYLWIDEWLQCRFNVDPARININGHSMGSAGTTALAKCFPEHYASASIFNNGFDGPAIVGNSYLFGPFAEDFPTNLVNRNGETVRISEPFNLIDNCSPQRDLPLFRSWHSKNDDNGVMRWDSNVVKNYIVADSLGMGMQLFWSERGHGIDTGPDYDDQWHDGDNPNQQTLLDDVAFEENLRSDLSYPAFFNHRPGPNARDPGTGLIGINLGDGDNWGTWGGYHRWSLTDLADSPTAWAATAWLEAGAVFPNDNCPVDSLTADLAVRRPQQFKPASGTAIYWWVKDPATGNVQQSGATAVQADDLPVVPQVVVFKENIRKVRIEISTNPTAAGEAEGVFSKMAISPNPSGGEAVLAVFSKKEMVAEVGAVAVGGSALQSFKTTLKEGENRLPLNGFRNLPAGFYFIEINGGGQRGVVKWVKN